MALGTLIINVYADNIAQPVADADIEITGGNLYKKVRTNLVGKIPTIPLQAPDKKYSLTPQEDIKPYSEYKIHVYREGLQEVIVEGVQIFDGQTSIQNIYMASESIKHSFPRTYTIPAHNLWYDYPPKLAESPIKAKALDSKLPEITEVFIPDNIVVHDGIPTNNSASNYITDFRDYIKNVASSEIYCTWPKETIKANVLAIISFTLNRIYTQWYMHDDYLFTITSSAIYDQSYIQGRTIFQSIANIVDSIFNQYISIPNFKQPLLAQYSNGDVLERPGWLSQWGSKELGDRGLDALTILKRFYGNDISIATTNIFKGNVEPFSGTNLTIGSCGPDVQLMQNKLNAINGSYSTIEKTLPSDGIFTQSMESNVSKFQQVFDIPATGVIDFTTWYSISHIYSELFKMLDGIYQQ